MSATKTIIVARRAEAPPPAKMVNKIMEVAPIKNENVAGKKEKKAMTLSATMVML